MSPVLILASASPRRTALLTQIGIAHRVFPVDIDEVALANESPLAQVERLAQEKAQAAYHRLSANEQEQSVVLASDTLISFNGNSLGKPRNKAHFLEMLSALSAQTHDVLTAICVTGVARQKSRCIHTQVQFAPLTEDEMLAYWATGEPADKAGGYAIQGIGGQFVQSINGSVSAVIGLPLYETKCLLHEFGVSS